MKHTISIELGASGAVGTKATVTTKRLLLAPRKAVFVCHRGAALISAEWINEETGIAAESELAMLLNEAAQAAARLAGKA
jgi:cell division septum initiation protein DivIVA